MVNHLRTLLLGADGRQGHDPDRPWEEYVPPDYRPPVLSGPLLAVRRILFGADPDRAYLGYRLAQLLALIHDTDLAHWGTALDNRLTYRPVRDRPWAEAAWGLTVTQPSGQDRAAYPQGVLAADDDRGTMDFAWRLAVQDDGLTLAVEHVRPAGPAVTVALVVTAGLAAPVDLPGGGGAGLSLAPAAGAVWHVTGLARPGRTLVELDERLRSLVGPEAGQSALFAGPDPLPVLARLWEEGGGPHRRLAAAALALAWQTEARRVGPE